MSIENESKIELLSQNMSMVVAMRHCIDRYGFLTPEITDYIKEQIRTIYLEDRERSFYNEDTYQFIDGEVIAAMYDNITLAQITDNGLKWAKQEATTNPEKQLMVPYAEAEHNNSLQTAALFDPSSRFNAFLSVSARDGGHNNELMKECGFTDERMGRAALRLTAIAKDGSGEMSVDVGSTFWDMPQLVKDCKPSAQEQRQREKVHLEELHDIMQDAADMFGGQFNRSVLDNEIDTLQNNVSIDLGGISVKSAMNYLIYGADKRRTARTGVEYKNGWSVADGKSELADELMDTYECNRVLDDAFTFFEGLAYCLGSQPSVMVKSKAANYLLAQRQNGESMVLPEHSSVMQGLANGSRLVDNHAVETVLFYERFSHNILIEAFVEKDQAILDEIGDFNNFDMGSAASVASSFTETHSFDGTCASEVSIASSSDSSSSASAAGGSSVQFKNGRRLTTLEAQGKFVKTGEGMCAVVGDADCGSTDLEGIAKLKRLAANARSKARRLDRLRRESGTSIIDIIFGGSDNEEDEPSQRPSEGMFELSAADRQLLDMTERDMILETAKVVSHGGCSLCLDCHLASDRGKVLKQVI